MDLSRSRLERPPCPPYLEPMSIGILRKLLAVLTAIAFLGVAAVQAMPHAGMAMPGSAAGPMDDCTHMGMAGTPPQTPMKQMPCKGITPDCIDQMGCVAPTALPMPSITLLSPIEHAHTAYWSQPSLRDGLTTKPELLPPRTL